MIDNVKVVVGFIVCVAILLFGFFVFIPALK